MTPVHCGVRHPRSSGADASALSESIQVLEAPCSPPAKAFAKRAKSSRLTDDETSRKAPRETMSLRLRAMFPSNPSKRSWAKRSKATCAFCFSRFLRVKNRMRLISRPIDIAPINGRMRRVVGASARLIPLIILTLLCSGIGIRRLHWQFEPSLAIRTMQAVTLIGCFLGNFNRYFLPEQSAISLSTEVMRGSIEAGGIDPWKQRVLPPGEPGRCYV